MLSQIIKIIRLLGLRRAARMKKHHEQGLAYVRGYTATCCWWTLLHQGALDHLAKTGTLPWRQYAKEHQWDEHVLEAIIEYLDGIGLLICHDSRVTLSESGKVLLAEPRGLMELSWAYEPCFAQMTDLLTGQKKYGHDLQRRITYVGLGSGRLCEQLPYPVMRRMVLDHGCKMVLDLGCGDLAFLEGLCRMDNQIRCHGIDSSEEMIRFDQERLQSNHHDNRLTVQQGDMFALPRFPPQLPQVDCITACDTFHEYLHDPQQLVNLLHSLRQRFPKAIFVIGEFCLQDPNWLRKHPTASLEHHLFHQLSNQKIGTADQWRTIFQQAGLEILEEQIFDLIGHGYFALQ